MSDMKTVCAHISLAAVVLIAALSCDMFTPTTFKEVSQPYVDQYGQPDDIYDYDSDDYHSVSYWWWCAGLNVRFVSSTYDDTYGWRVDSEYRFGGICY